MHTHQTSYSQYLIGVNAWKTKKSMMINRTKVGSSTPWAENLGLIFMMFPDDVIPGGWRPSA